MVIALILRNIIYSNISYCSTCIYIFVCLGQVENLILPFVDGSFLGVQFFVCEEFLMKFLNNLVIWLVNIPCVNNTDPSSYRNRTFQKLVKQFYFRKLNRQVYLTMYSNSSFKLCVAEVFHQNFSVLFPLHV